MMLGDFNARVGFRKEDDQWWHEREPFGHDDLNEAGEELHCIDYVITKKDY